MTNHFDDGTPTERFRRDRSFRRNTAKSTSINPQPACPRDAAVCRQAQKAITIELMSLDGLYGVKVFPAPDASRLRVELRVDLSDLASFQAALSQLTPRLRASVARALTRKRAPELCVFVRPCLLGEEVGE